MKRLVAVPMIAFLTVALSGCVAEPPEAPSTPEKIAVEPARLPDPITATEQVVGGHDPFNQVEGRPCARAESTCFHYPFEITAAQNASGVISVEAKLSWGVEVSDFDLYLFRGETEAAAARNLGANAPDEEHLKAKIWEGKWDLVVVAWAVATDTFTFEASFTRTPNPINEP